MMNRIDRLRKLRDELSEVVETQRLLCTYNVRTDRIDRARQLAARELANETRLKAIRDSIEQEKAR